MLLERLQLLTAIFRSGGMDASMPAVVEALRDVLGDAAVYLASRRGRVLARALPPGRAVQAFDAQWSEAGQLPDHVAAGVLKVNALCTGPEARLVTGTDHSAILPVTGAGRRVGTLLLIREAVPFSGDELALAEVAAMGAGLVISAALSEEEEGEAKERQVARTAVRSLSYSEVVAVQRLLDELKGEEGLLVASRIADEAGITRSVVVNALRKLASANVIESRSLGMKGTYLRVLNKKLRGELSRQHYPQAAPVGLRRRP